MDTLRYWLPLMLSSPCSVLAYDSLDRKGFMETCCVYDFSLSDLLQPTGARFRQLISAAINFISFSDQIVLELQPYRTRKVSYFEFFAFQLE